MFPIPIGSCKRKNHNLVQHWSERNEGVHFLARTGNRETFTWQSVENVLANNRFFSIFVRPCKQKNHHLTQNCLESKGGVHLLARSSNRETFTRKSVENVPSNDSFSHSVRLA